MVTIGHSAGGHLAVWAAARARSRRSTRGVAERHRDGGDQSGRSAQPARAADTGVGGAAVPDLLGGIPAAVPQITSSRPHPLLPLAVPVRAMHSRDDDTVPFDQSSSYVQAATSAGDDAVLVEVPGTHMDMIDSGTPAWAAVLAALDELSR